MEQRCTVQGDRGKAWAIESETMVPNCELGYEVHEGKMEYAKVLFKGEGQVH